MLIKLIVLLFLAVLIVFGTLYFLFSKKSISNIMSLLFITVCGGIVLIVSGFQFLGFAQILIYTGSISIMMLFALMLIGFIPSETSLLRRKRYVMLIPVTLAFAIFIFYYAFYEKYLIEKFITNTLSYKDSVREIGLIIYNEFIAPFDLAVLLLFPVLISISLLHRNVLNKRFINTTVNKIPVPPAVYAQNNSVDNQILTPVNFKKNKQDQKPHQKA